MGRLLLVLLGLSGCTRDEAPATIVNEPTPSASGETTPTPPTPTPSASGETTPTPTTPTPTPAPAAVATPAAASRDQNDARFHDLVRAAADDFARWGRVDDEARWAPGLCRMPIPALARYSAADGEGEHAQKLYALSALDPVAYGARPGGMFGERDPRLAAVTQAIVKEAFVPRETTTPSGEIGGPHNLRTAEHDGHHYEAGDPAGLYVMIRIDEAAEGTDHGWIYASVTASGEITGAGRMSTCMGCHVEAGEGRLFGLPTAH